MKRNYRLLLLSVLLVFTQSSLFGSEFNQAQIPDSSRRMKDFTKFITFKTQGGTVLQTTDIVSGDHAIPSFAAATLQYGYASNGLRWQDQVYGLPYFGVGIYTANFFRTADIGDPIAFYFFQGAQWSRLSPRWTIQYEWNLGCAMNWKPYDPISNPGSKAFSAPWSVYVALNTYLKWKMSSAMDLSAGLQFSHFSNGGTRQPNNGLNMISPTLALQYNFGRKTQEEVFHLIPKQIAPPFKPHFEHDIYLTSSQRQVKFDTLGTGLPSEYVSRSFQVLGLSYNLLYAPAYRYKYGLSGSLFYDASSGAKVWRDQGFERVKIKGVGECLSMGLALYGEVTAERFSFFANLGYNLMHSQKKDPRLYQLIAMKYYLQEDLFALFGVRAGKFSSAQFLYWSIGYTLGAGRKD